MYFVSKAMICCWQLCILDSAMGRCLFFRYCKTQVPFLQLLRRLKVTSAAQVNTVQQNSAAAAANSGSLSVSCSGEDMETTSHYLMYCKHSYIDNIILFTFSLLLVELLL